MRYLAVILVAGILSVPSVLSAGRGAASTGDEQTDVWEWLRHRVKKEAAKEPPDSPQERRKGSILFVPIITSKPSTGPTFGAGASLELPLGDLDDTYVSSVLTSASVSTKKYFSVTGRLSLFGHGHRWIVAGDNHLSADVGRPEREPASR